MNQEIDPDSRTSDRRTEILDAAMKVFVRYGFKKTSVDDIARAAGISRQGLYLHYANKTELFRGVAQRFMDHARAQRQKVLASESEPLEAKLLEAFFVTHGSEVGSEHLEELIASTVELVGDVLQAAGSQLAKDVANALLEDGVAAYWAATGISAAELTDHLVSASVGIKHIARSPAEYRQRMEIAVKLVCGPASQ